MSGGAAEGRVLLVLPYPPSVNRLWRHVGARVYKTATARQYGATVAVLVRAHADWQTLRPPYAVSVHLYPPDARVRDLDNTLKVLLDSVWRALGQDDVTIDALHVLRRPLDRQNARCLVTIEPAPTGAED